MNKVKNTIKHITRWFSDLMNQLIPPRGINLGGGDWFKWKWRNFDARHNGKVIDSSTRLPFKDESLAFVFSSHFFEHIDDLVVDRLVFESYRVLKPSGILRIVVPDFELALVNYRASNDSFFDQDWGLQPRYENWEGNGVPANLENKLAFVFFGYSNRDDFGKWPPWKNDPSYYCGPARIASEEVRLMALKSSIYEFQNWLKSHMPKDYFDLGHINCFDFAKFKATMHNAGFSDIRLSKYRGSKSLELRNPAFDNRETISLYIEATKT